MTDPDREFRSDTPDTPQPETDPRFPSGPWIGYYHQSPSQARQRLGLTFLQGVISGEGRDPAGQFAVRGSYDIGSGRATLKKTYTTHTVEYDGMATDDGISGGWVIRGFGGMVEDKGIFQIWPDLSAGAGDALRVREEEPVGVGR